MCFHTLIFPLKGLLDEVSRAHTATLRRQRDRVRAEMREIFNPNFGSVFRTNSNRSLFFFELCKHADIYTSSIGNFLNYPLDFIFYAIRTAMPHEGPLSWPHLFSVGYSPLISTYYFSLAPFTQRTYCH